MKEETKRYHASGLEIKEVQFANEVLLPEVVKMLNEGHTVTLRLRGFSMRPFLEDNRDKALLTKPIHSQEGDVVLAETGPRHYVLHRIVKIQGDNVTLRGDGNLAVERCKMADIKGRAYSLVWTSLLPFRRYLLAFYRRIWLKIFKPQTLSAGNDQTFKTN